MRMVYIRRVPRWVTVDGAEINIRGFTTHEMRFRSVVKNALRSACFSSLPKSVKSSSGSADFKCLGYTTFEGRLNQTRYTSFRCDSLGAFAFSSGTGLHSGKVSQGPVAKEQYTFPAGAHAAGETTRIQRGH